MANEYGQGMMNPNFGMFGGQFGGPPQMNYFPGWNQQAAQGWGQYMDDWQTQMNDYRNWQNSQMLQQQQFMQQNPGAFGQLPQQQGQQPAQQGQGGFGMNRQQMGAMTFPWEGPNSNVDFRWGGAQGTPMFGLNRDISGTSGFFNPAAMGWGAGGEGGGGWGQNPTMSPFSGRDYQVPGKWSGGSMDAPQSSADAADMIQRMQPILQRQRESGYAQAGDRLGQSGFAMSTPYAQQLGDTERQLQENLAKEAWGVQAGLDEQRANRDLAAQQNQFNRQLQAWGQHGGWQHGGQLAGMGQDLASWQQMGNWDQQNANRDFGAWQTNMQNQMMQQQMMQSLLPMLMGGFGA
jgi:hypothetical protein